MVKSKATAEKRMARNIVGAGASLKEGFEEAENPVDKLVRMGEDGVKRQVAGVQEAARKGKQLQGLKKAQARGSWIASKDRAASHFEERGADMVAHAMETYDGRAKCLEDAKKALEKEPRTTRAQREAYGVKYRTLTAECMDKLYGRTA